MNSITTVILAGFEWGMRIAKLNLLWFMSCLAGLMIFSFFPATVAAFSVADEWAKGNTEVSIWRTFKQTFRSKYGRSQATGYLLSLGFLILYVDIQFFRTLDHVWIKNIVLTLLFILLFILVIIALYILPLTVTFELSMKETFKTSMYYGLSSMHWTIISLVGVFAIAVVTYRFPASFIFLSSAGMILWLTCMTQIVRRKIERKYEQLHSTIK